MTPMGRWSFPQLKVLLLSGDVAVLLRGLVGSLALCNCHCLVNITDRLFSVAMVFAAIFIVVVFHCCGA
jgi:hypothetical protein